MKTGIYKEVQIDSCHRLLHYKGKCSNLHGHRWKIEVWIDGVPTPETEILIDFAIIREIIEKYDHQVLLNQADPLVKSLEIFQRVITTPGDPTSELVSRLICADIQALALTHNLSLRVRKIVVWESPTAYAEIRYEDL